MKRIMKAAAAAATILGTTATIVPTPAGAANAPEVEGFWLVDADNNALLDYLEPGSSVAFERAYLPANLSMRADTTFDTESVMWERDGVAPYQLENLFPYALNGDNAGDYNPAPFSLGLTDIAATAYSEDNQGGEASARVEVRINLYESDFVVDTTDDSQDANPGDGICSTGGNLGGITTSTATCGLRAAIEEANALPGSQSISIDGRLGTYELHHGPLYIDDSVSLNGYRMPVISAADQHKVFGVGFQEAGVLATFNGVRIKDGNASRDESRDGMIRGGGISALNGSTVQFFDSIVEDSRGNYGGGMYVSQSHLLMRRSVVRDNIAGTPDNGIDGGGITQRGGGLRIARSTATIEDSSIYGNWAVRGGGLSINSSNVRITNTSIVENRAEAIGGGLEVHDGEDLATVSIAFSTIARNEAGRAFEPPEDSRNGGGIWNNGQVLIGNSILAENTDHWWAGHEQHAPDCYSPKKHRFTSMRGNFVGVLNDNCVMADTIHGGTAWFEHGTENTPLDPGFEVVENGPNSRKGLKLENFSIAVNGGTGVTSSTFFDCPKHDGFGRPRPVSAGCDAGALERQHVAIDTSGTPGDFKVESELPEPHSKDEVDALASRGE